MIEYEIANEDYKHWKIEFEDYKATLFLDVSEKDGIRDGYELKLNSYDLGVDIELNDIIQRIRFEKPSIKVVIITSKKEKNFSAGANIYMLGMSEHAWKVNFCKFTNETRNGLEDSSKSGSLRFIAAINGVCAGGGYEVALACNEILLVDDRSSTVSLPEVPLLGVLPGTGGITRLIDKRKVRKDLADIFCTNADGIRGKKALDWKLVDFIAPPSKFDELIDNRAKENSKLVKLRNSQQGIKLKKLNKKILVNQILYDTLKADIDRDKRIAKIRILAPMEQEELNMEKVIKLGSDWWLLKFIRELDNLILHLRSNELEIGVLSIESIGNNYNLINISNFLIKNTNHWYVNEILGFYRRTLSRIDISSRSVFVLIGNESCFTGILSEIIFVADRSYMLNNEFNDKDGPFIQLNDLNFNYLEMVNEKARLVNRFYEDEVTIKNLKKLIGKPLNASDALKYGLITIAPDDLDWADEIRLDLEERASFSPDALTGLEANLRFAGKETCETKIFGRLSAWQNWIFNRPNASSDKGALKLFGTGTKAKFDNKRV